MLAAFNKVTYLPSARPNEHNKEKINKKNYRTHAHKKHKIE